MAKARPKKGSIVEVSFYDHCEGGHDAILCTVWGKVVNITKRAYTIQTWKTAGDDSDENKSQFNIVKGTITDLKTLSPRNG